MAIYLRLTSVPELQRFPRRMRRRLVMRCFDEIKQMPLNKVVRSIAFMLLVMQLLLAMPIVAISLIESFFWSLLGPR